uniref:Uncharacterized protein n=1 Tax=Latimeria chalumnae TaxID=7897 RepID=H3A1S4_LATCH
RSWLVYSQSSDKVFCFCCVLFGKHDNAISKDSFNTWKCLSSTLKDHEHSLTHVRNMELWRELKARISGNKTIDSVNMELLAMEKNYWGSVLTRIVCIVCHLADGTKEKLHDPRRHILQAIVEKVHRAKYFGVTMDSTPDISHTEQLSITLRIVNCELSVGASIGEHFVGFLAIEATTGEALCNTLFGHLKNLKIDIDCRGQAYDNGSNMKGKKQGVQQRVLEISKKPCSSHSLNLVGLDAAKSSVMSVTFLGVLQRIFTIFSSSTQRWSILKQYITQLTVKLLSDARWECCIESAKALRYQLNEVHSALEALADHAVQKKDSRTALEACSLAREISSGPFLLCLVVWHDVLFQINRASKLLQTPNVAMDTLKNEINAILKFLQDYRENGFVLAHISAWEIADHMNIEITFPEERIQRKNMLFDYECPDDVRRSPEEKVKHEFFLPLVDTAVISLKERFSQMETFYSLFDFLFNIKEIRMAIDANTLSEKCLVFLMNFST